MRRFIVVGLGIFGSNTAMALYDHGHEVVALDIDEAKVDRIAPKVTRAAVCDARVQDILDRVGAREADAAVISTGDDISSSILAAMALRDLGVGDIYVKVVSLDHARVMRRLGFRDTIFPERESALNLASRITFSNALLNYVTLSEGFSIQEMAVPNKWRGQSLRQLEIRSTYSVSVVAVHDVLTDRMNPVPDPDAQLKDSDTLVIAGSTESLARVARID